MTVSLTDMANTQPTYLVLEELKPACTWKNWSRSFRIEDMFFLFQLNKSRLLIATSDYQKPRLNDCFAHGGPPNSKSSNIQSLQSNSFLLNVENSKLLERLINYPRILPLACFILIQSFQNKFPYLGVSITTDSLPGMTGRQMELSGGTQD